MRPMLQGRAGVSRGALAVCLLLPVVAQASARSSCPLSTAVYPFSQTNLSRYEVAVTDGGPGDLDGQADGSCEFDLTLCLGTRARPAVRAAACTGPGTLSRAALAVPTGLLEDGTRADVVGACTSQPLVRLRAQAAGGVGIGVRRQASRTLRDQLMRFDGAHPNDRTAVDFPGPGSVDACTNARFAVPVDDVGRLRRLRLRFAVRTGADPAKRQTNRTLVAFRCVAPSDDPTVTDAPTCRGLRGACPPLATSPTPPTTTPVPATTTTTVTPGAPTTTSTTPTSATTTTTLSPSSSGPTYYLSPGGNDGQSGTSTAAAWRTFGHALGALHPGDALVLLDGTYTPGTTGLPAVDCRSGGNASSGTSSAPITMRAANERRAFLDSDGSQAAFSMRGCAWWRVEGLRLENTDNAGGTQIGGYPFYVSGIDNVEFRRLLGAHNNREQNTHVFAVEDSTHVLMEECEAYFFHRHAFSFWRSRWVTVRRCYANSMRYGGAGCCSTIDNRDYGDEGFSIYGTSDSVVENSVSENRANGFQIHGIANALDPSGSGGRRNKVLGCLSLDDAVPALISSRVASGKYNNARDNEFHDFVAAGMDGNGIYMRGAAGAVIDHVTLVGSTGSSGLAADSGDSQYGGTCGSGNPDGCSFRATNVLTLGHADAGIYVTGVSDWTVSWADASGSHTDFSPAGEPIEDASGHLQHAMSVAAPQIGMSSGQCVAWAPAGSAVSTAGAGGSSLGAQIVNRYQDGALTDQPLWDPCTGAFPCGAVVAGINDGPIACSNLHSRLRIDDRSACPLP